MKIIRWLLSHFFLIVLVVVVIYGYMFWGNLLGENTPAGKAVAYLSSEFVEVEEFVNAVKAKQAQLSDSNKQPVGKAEVRGGENRGAGVSAIVTAPSPESKTVATRRDIAQQPVSISYSHNQKRVRQNSVGEIVSQPEPPTKALVAQPATRVETRARPDIAQRRLAAPTQTSTHKVATENIAPPVASTAPATQEKFVPEKVERQLQNVDKNGQLINKALQGDAIRESWITARKSFYQRNYELSEQSYKDVIDNTTDNFDAYGELGNVYFNQGKKEEAAKAYFEAASILIRKGQIRRVKSLMGLMRHLDKEKAAELQKLIDSAVS